MHLTGEGPGAILRFEAFLSFINRLLFMGSQRVRHDWATELNWTEWLYNIQLKTSKGILFWPPSDAYVRSFLYLLYSLIKLYYTKALSDQAWSLTPDWILLLQEPRIPASWFNNNLSPWKRCTQYASKFGKLSSGHRTGNGQFHFNPKERQCQRMFKLPHNCTHLTC